jgi:DNA primase large subunit
MQDYNYLLKFPFSNKAKEYLSNKRIDLLSVEPIVLEKVRKFLIEEINQEYKIQEKYWFNISKIDDEIIASSYVMIYPLSKIILSIIDNTPLLQSFANYYQKRFIYFSKKETNAEVINSLATDICPSIKFDSKKEQYYVALIDLLTLDLGEDYKLQYTNLKEGNIFFINKEQLLEFLAVVLKKRILRTTEINKKELPKIYLEISEEIKKKFQYSQKAREDFDYRFSGKLSNTDFPPCFDKLYNDLLSGKKLSHIGNYHLAVFLSGVGYNYEDIINMYKHAPNFDERIAGYQIKKIIEKKYSIANCETLKSNDLCVFDCKVKHPLQLLKTKK